MYQSFLSFLCWFAFPQTDKYPSVQTIQISLSQSPALIMWTNASLQACSNTENLILVARPIPKTARPIPQTARPIPKTARPIPKTARPTPKTSIKDLENSDIPKWLKIPFNLTSVVWPCSNVSKRCRQNTKHSENPEPCHEKTCFSHMWTTKVQISLRIRAVWSISTFVVCCLDSIVPIVSISKISRP